MAQEAEVKLPPAFNFTIPPTLSEWGVPMKAWLEAKEKSFDGLHTSALVYDSQGRTLLLQRAPHDSMPNRWEPAGGAVDVEDESILHACARELWEEAGLVLRRLVRVVPASGEGSSFTNRTGQKIFYRFTFEVEVEDDTDVKTDPQEHTNWLWATEEEVQAEKREDGTEMPITAPMAKRILLEGFQLRKSTNESAS